MVSIGMILHSGNCMRPTESRTTAVLYLWLYDSSEDDQDNMDIKLDLDEDTIVNDITGDGQREIQDWEYNFNEVEYNLDEDLYCNDKINQHDDNQQEDLSRENNDGLFGTIEKGKEVTLKLMDALKGEFGVIMDTAKMAGIPLFAKRDVPTCINDDIDDLKRKHQGFDGAALRMTKRRNDMGIVDRCVEINQQIKRLNSSGNYAPVAVFVYLLKYSFLFKEADASEDHQKLNQDLLVGLEIKSAPQYSRFRRNCDRVKNYTM